MRAIHALAVSLLFAVAACDPPAPAPSDASAENAGGALTDADRTALLAAIDMQLNAQGQVMNACDELVTPRILPAELGGDVGAAQLIAIDGGPNMASCYGDGPDLHLLRRVDGGWHEIYGDRGGVLIVLPTQTGGVRDIADGGPGFSFPVLSWNGNEYAPTGRDIADRDLGDAEFLP